MIGETFGNFRVVSRIGRGGMGEVYLAEQQSIGTRVAIKFLHPDISESEDHVQRFFNEARAVSRIQHAGIVKIFDCGKHASGQAYLVMELLDGESLRRRISRGPLSLAQVCDVGRQIASVLDATHAAGITHRDLKPDNIYLVPDRELASKERVKVLDFGIAKLTGTLAGASPRTTGTLGTPAYMAPEQWGDSSKVDWRADVYALGCVAFEMATGKVPFPSESFAEACAKHLSDPPPVANVQPDLDRLLLRMLAKDPAQRPQSMQEIGAAFEVIGKGAGSAIVAGPTSAQQQFAPTVATADAIPRRRSKLWIVPVAHALAGAVVAAMLALRSDDDAKVAAASDAAVVENAASRTDDAAVAGGADGAAVAGGSGSAAVAGRADDAAVASGGAAARGADAALDPTHTTDAGAGAAIAPEITGDAAHVDAALASRAAEAFAAKKKSLFDPCYATRKGAVKVVITAAFTTTGKVASVSTDERDEKKDACLRGGALLVTLDPPPAAPFTHAYELSLAAPKKAKQVGDDVADPIGGPITTAFESPQEWQAGVLRQMRALAPTVQRCRTQNERRVVVRIEVGESGNVARIATPNAAFKTGECVSLAAAKLFFGKPPAGAQRVFKVPYLFQ